MKRIIILSLAVLLLLCACDSGENSSNNNTLNGQLSESIFGTWYPHPEVSATPFIISEDGTCTYGGQTMEFEVQSADFNTVILTAGNYHLTFTHLESFLPLLSEGSVGLCTKEPEVWNYMQEWFDPERQVAFTLDLELLSQTECNLIPGNGQLSIEVLENGDLTYIVTVTANEATVTNITGNFSTIYYPIDGGGSSSGDTDDVLQILAKAEADFHNVLAGGEMFIYPDGSDNGISLSGAEAIEELYQVFSSLQNQVDVQDYLNCIKRIDNVLISHDRTIDTSTYTSKYSYNCYGQQLGISAAEAANSGEYLFFGRDGKGDIVQVTICGVVAGAPIYDAHGRLTGLKIKSSNTYQEYVCPITYDAEGRIIRIDIPFLIIGYSGTTETQFNEFYEFVYDDTGRLIQYSVTQQSSSGIFENTEFYQTYHFFSKDVTEYYYAQSGKLVKTVTHHMDEDASGAPGWWYAPNVLTYDSNGNLIKEQKANHPIGNIPTAEWDRMHKVQDWLFCSKGFVDSVGQNLLGQLGAYLKVSSFEVRMEYKYGSIYIYQPEA